MIMDTFKKIIAFAIALIFLGGCVYCLYLLFNFLFFDFPQLFLSASTNIKVAVISFIGTAFVSVITIVISKHIEKEADFRRAQYQSKLETYQLFLDDIFANIFLPSNGKNNDHQEKKFQKQIEAIKKFITKVTLWGSDEVIHATSLWLLHLRTQGNDKEKMHASLREMEELFRAIRKDLGHSNKKIQTGDILRMFIIDYDETVGCDKKM